MARSRTPLLPGMSALRCFDAAARTECFTQAAAALNLTQSAVSRQVSGLEDQLGTRLFARSGPYLKLTDRGRAFAAAVSPALAAIAQATDRFRSEIDEGIISVATLPSFGMRWLAPRLANLTRECPELVVNLFARSDEFDFSSETYDAAIHFGEADWPHAHCDRLFDEDCVTVAAPALVGDRSGYPAPQAHDLPLLVLAARPRAWEAWQAQTGVSLSGQLKGRYEHFTMLAQAAVAGTGCALIPEYLIRDELRDGRLVPLAQAPLRSDGAYFLVYPPEKLEKSAFRKFRRWLLAEAASEQAGAAGERNAG